MRRSLGLFRQSTGLAGLPVHPNPRPAILSVYKQTLEALKDFPQDAAYTQSVLKITQQRMHVVESHDQVDDIEQQLGAGCIEEVLVQATDELSLLKQMKEWKPWESLEVKPASNQWTYFK